MNRGRPAGRLVGTAAIAAGLVTILLTGLTTGATVAGVLGVAIVWLSRRRSSRVLATIGPVTLFGGTVLAAAAGAAAAQLLVAGVAIVLTWTFAHAAIDLRRSVGTAESRDHELAHVAGTTALVGGAAVPIYLVASIDWGTIPSLSVALFLVAALALTVALGR